VRVRVRVGRVKVKVRVRVRVRNTDLMEAAVSATCRATHQAPRTPRTRVTSSRVNSSQVKSSTEDGVGHVHNAEALRPAHVAVRIGPHADPMHL
jgi:hypothetical protein